MVSFAAPRSLGGAGISTPGGAHGGPGKSAMIVQIMFGAINQDLEMMQEDADFLQAMIDLVPTTASLRIVVIWHQLEHDTTPSPHNGITGVELRPPLVEILKTENVPFHGDRMPPSAILVPVQEHAAKNGGKVDHLVFALSNVPPGPPARGYEFEFTDTPDEPVADPPIFSSRMFAPIRQIVRDHRATVQMRATKSWHRSRFVEDQRDVDLARWMRHLGFAVQGVLENLGTPVALPPIPAVQPLGKIGVGYAAVITRGPDTPPPSSEVLAADRELLLAALARAPDWVRIKLVLFEIHEKGKTDGFLEFPDIGDPPIDKVFLPNADAKPDRPHGTRFTDHLVKWFEDNAHDLIAGELDVVSYRVQNKIDNPPKDSNFDLRGASDLVDETHPSAFAPDFGDLLDFGHALGVAGSLGGQVAEPVRWGSEPNVMDYRTDTNRTTLQLAHAVDDCVRFFQTIDQAV